MRISDYHRCAERRRTGRHRRRSGGPWILTSLAAALACVHPTPMAAPEVVAITAVPVALHPEDPALDRVGSLCYRGGLELRSPHRAFGGFSGLVVDPGGGRLTAVSDRGHWLSAELRYDAEGRLADVGEARLGPLLDLDGEPVAGRYSNDAEELVELPGGDFLVSFEGTHRLLRYAPSDRDPRTPSGRPASFAHPEGIAAADENGGMEAVARLAGDHLLVLAQDLRDATGDRRGWLGDPGGESWHDLRLAPRGEPVPTAAAGLPSGGVLLLERSYRPAEGNRVRVSCLEPAALVPGARLEPRELAAWAKPMSVDNLEALAVRPGPGGETYLYLMSDDNFSPTQRTLLLYFEVCGAAC